MRMTVQLFSDSVLSVGRNNSNSSEVLAFKPGDLCHETECMQKIDLSGREVQFAWHVFFMNAVEPDESPDRIFFKSMFNDIEWRREKCEKSHGQTTCLRLTTREQMQRLLISKNDIERFMNAMNVSLTECSSSRCSTTLSVRKKRLRKFLLEQHKSSSSFCNQISSWALVCVVQPQHARGRIWARTHASCRNGSSSEFQRWSSSGGRHKTAKKTFLCQLQ